MPAESQAPSRPFAAALGWLGGLLSNERRARRGAERWLELAGHLWNWRRDLMSAAEAEELGRRRDALARSLRERADPGKLKLGVEALEGAMRAAGGAVYPRSALSENAEFFLVAALVILGVRTYFVQNFEIPTNSMWPTYYGMTAESFPPGGPGPGAAARALRLGALLAWPTELRAPAAGPVSALFFAEGRLAYTVVDGRSWLIFPAKYKEYTFLVGDLPAKVRVPYDFDSEFNRVAIDALFGGEQALAERWRRLEQAGGPERTEVRLDDESGRFAQAWKVPAGRDAREGEELLRFDVLTGDKLLVDRFSYHFFRPRPGSAMVFRTADIPALHADQFFVKRLVGVPGDVLSIREPALYRNGRPIEGAEAFGLNARRVPPYRGYFNGDPANGARLLLPGESLTVPPHAFFGLGDNSANSLDGRYWGFVPERDLIGRPLFIYYPFTRRWGRAR